MKKKLIGGVILASVAFMLASCDFSSGVTNSNVDITPTTEVEQNDERYKIYLLALGQGYTGTYQEWLDSIKGASISLQVANGYIQMKYSNETEWINLISIDDLKGEAGLDGKTTELKVADGFIQWKYEDEGSNSWRNLISLSALTGSEGKAGKEIELSVNDEYILWKYSGDNVWNNLISLSTITGKDGKPGKEVELSVNDEYIIWRYKDTDEWFELVELESIKGKTGVGISLVEINSEGELVLTYSDGSTVNAGKVKADTEFNHTYTVTFDIDNGGEVFTQVVPWGGGPQEPVIKREGYFFDGWYIGTRKWDFYTNYYPYDMTLTGRYIPMDFRIFLHKNGGTLDEQYVHVYYDKEYTLPTPTKAGYSFAGWYDENGNKVEDGIYKIENNLDVYARWEADHLVTATFNPNGGELENLTEEVASLSYYVAPKPTYEGYAFLGWKDSNGNIFKEGYFEYTDDVSFTAVWGESFDAIEDKTITIYVPYTLELSGVTYTQIMRYFESIGAEFNDYNIDVKSYDNFSDNELGDIFVINQDQLDSIVKKGYATEIPSNNANVIRENNPANCVDHVTVSDKIYAYPFSTLTGLVMYYDTRAFDGVDMNSLEAIIQRCEGANRTFGYDLNNIWYSAGFFFGTGCKSEWYINSNGEFVDLDDTFNSEQGKVALSGMYKLLNSSCWYSSSNAYIFDDEERGAVLISGTWNENEVKARLGEYYGVCKLPSFVGSDGNTYQIGSYTAGRIMCVKPQTDALKEKLLNNLAAYLSSPECQLERYEELGIDWLPTYKDAASSEVLENNEVAQALFAQNQYAVSQGYIYSPWWTIGNQLAEKVRLSDGSGNAFVEILNGYMNSIYESIEFRPAFYGQWQDFSTEDLTANMVKNDNGEYEVTITISEDDYKYGKIYQRGSNTVAFADYTNVDEASKTYLNLEICDVDNINYFITFKEAGTYTITYDRITNVVHITKEA